MSRPHSNVHTKYSGMLNMPLSRAPFTATLCFASYYLRQVGHTHCKPCVEGQLTRTHIILSRTKHSSHWQKYRSTLLARSRDHLVEIATLLFLPIRVLDFYLLLQPQISQPLEGAFLTNFVVCNGHRAINSSGYILTVRRSCVLPLRNALLNPREFKLLYPSPTHRK